MLKDPLEDKVDYLQRELLRQRKRLENHNAKMDDIIDVLNETRDFVALLRARVKKDGFVDEIVTLKPRKIELVGPNGSD